MTDEERRGASAEADVDVARRGFFRVFGREAFQAAAQVAGAATALRRGTAAAGTELLGLGLGDPEASAARLEEARLGRIGTLGAAPGEASAGFRSPYRLTADGLRILDQRLMPGMFSELSATTGAEVAGIIRKRAVNGGPLLAQLAAYGLAATADAHRTAKPHVRAASLRGSANALRNARPSVAALGWALDRLLARWLSVGEHGDGEVIADALRAEADAIASESTMDHARLGRLLAERLAADPRSTDRPGRPEGAELRLLVHGPHGALMNGMVGTGLSVVQALLGVGQPVHVWVVDAGPAHIGARLTAWELRQADVPHTVVPDAACGPLIAQGRVDVLLLSADRIAASGDTLAEVGSYGLAVLASRHGVPVQICTTTASVDLRTESGAGLRPDEHPAEELRALGASLAEQPLLRTAQDVTPVELLTCFAMEEGPVAAGDAAALRSAVEESEARRPPLPAPATEPQPARRRRQRSTQPAEAS